MRGPRRVRGGHTETTSLDECRPIRDLAVGRTGRVRIPVGQHGRKICSKPDDRSSGALADVQPRLSGAGGRHLLRSRQNMKYDAKILPAMACRWRRSAYHADELYALFSGLHNHGMMRSRPHLARADPYQGPARHRQSAITSDPFIDEAENTPPRMRHHAQALAGLQTAAGEGLAVYETSGSRWCRCWLGMEMTGVVVVATRSADVPPARQRWRLAEIHERRARRQRQQGAARRILFRR